MSLKSGVLKAKRAPSFAKKIAPLAPMPWRRALHLMSSTRLGASLTAALSQYLSKRISIFSSTAALCIYNDYKYYIELGFWGFGVLGPIPQNPKTPKPQNPKTPKPQRVECRQITTQTAQQQKFYSIDYRIISVRVTRPRPSFCGISSSTAFCEGTPCRRLSW